MDRHLVLTRTGGLMDRQATSLKTRQTGAQMESKRTDSHKDRRTDGQTDSIPNHNEQGTDGGKDIP